MNSLLYRIVLAACIAVSGCSSFLKSSTEKFDSLCYRPSSNVSVATYNEDYKGRLSILKSFPEECLTDDGRQFMKSNYHFYYEYELGKSYYDLKDYSNALTYFDAAISTPGIEYYYKNSAIFYKYIALTYSDPANAKSHLADAEKQMQGSMGSDLKFALYNAKYNAGDRSAVLLEAYLKILDDTLIPNPEDYANPISLAKNLNQRKVEESLLNRQRALQHISDKASSENIPGYGTASGNADLMIRRDAFYLSEYSKLGMLKQVDYYSADLKKHQNLSRDRAAQAIIDRAYEDARANEERENNTATMAELVNIMDAVSSGYVAGKKRAGGLGYDPYAKTDLTIKDYADPNIAPFVTHCVSNSINESEKIVLTNKCNFMVRTDYCYTGSFHKHVVDVLERCDQIIFHRIIEPASSISVNRPKVPNLKIFYTVCEAGNVNDNPTKDLVWTGKAIQGQCRKPEKAVGARSVGGVR